MLPTITKRTYKPFFMSDFFENDFLPGFTKSTSSTPAVNIREDEKRFTIDLALPGIDKKEVKIEINEDVLTISSEKRNEREENNENFYRKEFSYSSFCRSFYLPENIKRDNIEASYKDGILSVVLPREEEDKARLNRQISIS